MRHDALAYAGAVAQPRTRYGEQRGVSLPSILLTILLHVVLIAAVLTVRNGYIRKKEEALAVVNLMPPAPPPPAQDTPPPPAAPEIVAPTPFVQIPVPAQTVAVAEIPSPRPMPTVAPAPPAPPAPAPVAPSTIQSNDLGTRMVSGKPPRYPMESRKSREQGTVVLSITLGVDGKVMSISINQSSGSRRLDDAALSAVRGWRWQPTMRGGQPVQVRGLVEIPFVLRG